MRCASSRVASASSSCGHDPVDQADALGLGRVDDLGEEHQLLRPVQPDQPGQDPRAAEVHAEPALREDLGEPRPVRRDHQVAAEREVAPRAGRHPVDRGDRRDVELVQPQRAPADDPHRSAASHPVPSDSGPGVPGVGEVGPGAEPVAGAGEHEHAGLAATPRSRRRPRSAPATSARSSRSSSRAGSSVTVMTPSSRSTSRVSTVTPRRDASGRRYGSPWVSIRSGSRSSTAATSSSSRPRSSS